MTHVFNPEKNKTHQTDCTRKADVMNAVIREYTFSDKREQDILWMKYRNFRNVFDKIEKSK